MNPDDIGYLVEHWRSKGLDPMEMRDGQQVWKDVCVVESMFGGPTLECDWLVFDPEQRVAYLKGTALGAVIGRDNVVQGDKNA